VTVLEKYLHKGLLRRRLAESEGGSGARYKTTQCRSMIQGGKHMGDGEKVCITIRNLGGEARIRMSWERWETREGGTGQKISMLGIVNRIISWDHK